MIKSSTPSREPLPLPSFEECKLWETSFLALLNHPYGFTIFKNFSVKESSDENVDFWNECEIFKKMEEGTKSTTEKAREIYKEFVVSGSRREVNLDWNTRAATKTALDNGCKNDTFSLAQSRIEQLMQKDSYRRFLKDNLSREEMWRLHFIDRAEKLLKKENNDNKKENNDK